MKMRRWTSVTGGASGAAARKIQSETDCLRSASTEAGSAARSGNRHPGDQLARGVEAALHGLGVAVQAVADDRGKRRLHVLGKHLVAAFHERPGLRRAQDAHARARGEALREARRMA